MRTDIALDRGWGTLETIYHRRAAIESAMDELALLAGTDPLEFRLRHITDPRLRRVLEVVAEHSDWPRRRSGGGRGLGLACAMYNGTYIAEVAEVAVAQGGDVRFLAAWCAVDCGTVVDPDGARNQIEGGIVQGASWARFEELAHEDGRVAAAAWQDYRIATFRDGPWAIHVAFTDDGRTAPTGLGEPGVVSDRRRSCHCRCRGRGGPRAAATASTRSRAGGTMSAKTSWIGHETGRAVPNPAGIPTTSGLSLQPMTARPSGFPELRECAEHGTLVPPRARQEIHGPASPAQTARRIAR